MKSTHSNSIDIDVGGTFTDCFVHFNGHQVYAKSPTTNYDLSVGFMRALNKAAKQLNTNPETLLPQTNIVRYSTTLAMNKLLDRTGAKLGLITTEGFEDFLLIGKGAQWDDGLSRKEARNLALVCKPTPLIPRERIIGVKERVDYKGQILRPLHEDDFREKLHSLVGQGIRGMVVSLLWSHINPVHEIRAREIIEEEYSEACLGYVPVVLSHEVQPKKGEYQRTMTAVLDAYLQKSVAEDLGNMRRELRDAGYNGSILMVNNSGGMAELLKTTAVETYNGGNVAGIVGSLEIAKLYDFDNVVTTDMGGTSFDLGIISEGRFHFNEVKPTIDRWLIYINMLDCKTVGAGGGSIAWINEALGRKLEVGPQSAGSMPGPACYNLGGNEPTVTDADVILGYINPDFFHGGRIPLSRELASKAIYDKIAQPLGLYTEEAAANIRKLIDGNMGNNIFKETVLRGHDPREFILFTFGGAGPTHCCGYSRASHIRHLVAFPFSPVFCAFSGALMDVRHIHELSRTLIVANQGEEEPVLDIQEFNCIIDKLVNEAINNIKAEGLIPGKLAFILELDMKFIEQLHVRRIRSPRLRLRNKGDVSELLQAFIAEYSKPFGPAGVHRKGGVSIESLVLHAIYPFKKVDFPSFTLHESKPISQSRKGWRMVFWEDVQDFRRTSIYDYNILRCGNKIEGPAVVEASDTTIVIPQGALFHIDKYRNGIVELLD